MGFQPGALELVRILLCQDDVHTTLLAPLILAFTLASAAPAQAASRCNEAVGPALKPVETRWVQPQYEAVPYSHARFLLEFFGPLSNSFMGWLKWLESDAAEAPPLGIGLYRTARSLIIGKKQEFPIDAGVSEVIYRENEPARISSLMQISTALVQKLRGSSAEAQAGRKELLQLIDRELFGIYRLVESPSIDQFYVQLIKGDETMRASIARDNRHYRPRPVHDWIGWDLEGVKLPENPIHDFNKVANVIKQDADTVLVRVKLGEGAEPQNRNQELIQKMFFITHWQMVNKAYRETKLFADDLQTAMYLLNDFIKSTKSSAEPQDLYLMYERRAWESMVYRMNLAHKYVVRQWMAGEPPVPLYRYQTINDVFYPFYPVFGMMVERHRTGEYEYKRLFHNANTDPLGMLDSKLTNIRQLNSQFYHDVTAQVPAGSTLKAVSKTDAHTRLYEAFGFNMVSSGYNLEWQSQMDTLVHSRDAFFERTRPRR